MNRELLAAFDGALQKLLVLLPAVHHSVAGLRPLDADSRWALLRLNAEDLVDLLGLGQGERREVVEHLVARVGVERRRLPGHLDAQQRPGAAAQDLALQLEQQRRRQGG